MLESQSITLLPKTFVGEYNITTNDYYNSVI